MRAAEPAFSVETIVELLKREGLRITKSRTAIVKTLFQSKEPLTLQEIQEGAKAKTGVHPDYATVFRMITLMEKLHLVHKVNLQRTCSYYELNDPRKHYDHLVCRKCGHVVLLDMPCPLGKTEAEIEKRYGFRDLSHSLEFFGICPGCEKEPAS